MRKVRALFALSVFVCAPMLVAGAKAQIDEATDVTETQIVAETQIASESTDVPESEASVDQFPLPFIPPGACELPNGDCVVTLDTICRLLGGEFQGANTQCE